MYVPSVHSEVKRRLRHKVREARKLDDELFSVERFMSALKPVGQPEGTEGNAPSSPHIEFSATDQAEISAWSFESEEPTRSMSLHYPTSPTPSTQPHSDSDSTNTPPAAIDPRERLNAALDLEPHKVHNAPLTQMPDRQEFIRWERSIGISMDRMFADLKARAKKREDEEGVADDAIIVKRTHLQMLCHPSARPQHLEALAAAFQRERERPESTYVNDESSGMFVLRATNSHRVLVMSRYRCPKSRQV